MQSTLSQVHSTAQALSQSTALFKATLTRCAAELGDDPDTVLVQTFGGLFIVSDGKRVALRGKGRALLVELLAHGGQDVCATRIAGNFMATRRA